MSYTGGPITLTAGSKNFSVATGVLLVEAKKGDIIEVNGGRFATIDTITTNTAGTLLFNWPSPTVTAEAIYAIHHVGPGWEQNVSINENLVNLLAGLNTGATTAAPGAVRLATPVEAQAGSAADIAVTPAGLRAATREKLTTTRNYFVQPTGNDANDGLSTGTAFLTIARATTVIRDNIDADGQTVILNLANGTYTTRIDVPRIVGLKSAEQFIIRGNVASPTSVVISTTASHAVISEWALVSLEGLRLQTTGGGNGIQCSGGVVILSAAMVFGACLGTSHINVDFAGLVSIRANYSIVGGAGRHWNVYQAASIECYNLTITLTGTPAFSFAFAAAYIGNISVANLTFSGLATGARYSVGYNGFITVEQNTPTFLPGNAPGESWSGGKYRGNNNREDWVDVTGLVLSAGAGTITAYTINEAKYAVKDNVAFIVGRFTVTTNGTGASFLQLGNFPFPPLSSGMGVALNVQNSKMVACQVFVGDTRLFFTYYDGTYPVVSGQSIQFSAFCRL